MKNLFFALLPAGTLLALASGCQQRPADADLPCPEGALAITTLSHWHPSPACFGPRVEQAGQFQTYVINSLPELQAVSQCDSAGIDFSRYTLLAGKTKTVACNYLASQRVETTCDGLVYHVVLGPGACQAPSEALYTALIPKQPAGTRIRFDVQVQ